MTNRTSEIFKQLIREKYENINSFIYKNGFKRSTIYDLTSGKNNIRKAEVDLVIRIANSLDMTTEEFYYSIVSLEEDEEK